MLKKILNGRKKNRAGHCPQKEKQLTAPFNREATQEMAHIKGLLKSWGSPLAGWINPSVDQLISLHI